MQTKRDVSMVEHRENVNWARKVRSYSSNDGSHVNIAMQVTRSRLGQGEKSGLAFCQLGFRKLATVVKGRRKRLRSRPAVSLIIIFWTEKREKKELDCGVVWC